MSMALMVQAMKMKVGSTARKLVLLKLADNANDKGECFPSYQHIAEQCEMSRKTAIGHIDALCEMGLVKKMHRGVEKGNSSNIYKLNLAGVEITPPGVNITPRISHSFESVIEPKKTNKKISSDDSKPAKQVSRNRQSKIPYQDIIQSFNEAVGDTLPNAEILNDKRKRAIGKFWKELKNPSVDAARNYLEVFVKTANPWYFGKNDRGWRASFDYLLRPDTVTKTREGAL
uniref:Helix-turn-helix domain-containing protein n=1 Tax=Arsenophonus endosymbiont of Trialeurodes vaporariorum TaxID=235567 RepID=A0A3B0MMK9_9GAMM